MTTKQQTILFYKLKPCSTYQEVVGHLTPVEIKYLMDIGCKPKHGMPKIYADEAAQLIRLGDMRTNWFYFYPTKELLQKVRERYPEWKKHSTK